MKYLRTFVAAAFLLAPLSAATVASAQTPAAVVQSDYDALFKQMFQNPSNLEISFKFAELAAARGDYEAAIGALERMLFFNPNLPRVKLELGVLYFKLGSWDLARTYFQDAIQGGNVPDDIRAQVNAYLAEIARRQAPYEFSAFLHAGARWQSNANVGPNSLNVLALGQEALLSSQFGQRPDWNWFQLAAAQYFHKIGKRGDGIEATFIGYAAQQHRLTQFDLNLVEGTLGPRIVIDPNSSFKVYGIGTFAMLAHDDYIHSNGAGASIRGTVQNFTAEGYVEWRFRRFFDSFSFPTASDQTGNLITTAINTELRFGIVRLTGRAGYDRNEARWDFAFNSYHRWSGDIGLPIEFSVPALIGDGRRQIIVTPTGGYSDTRYDDANFIIDPFTARHDKEIRVGGVIDVQLYERWGLRATVMHTWIDSNLPNYELRNFSVAFGPTARF